MWTVVTIILACTIGGLVFPYILRIFFPHWVSPDEIYQSLVASLIISAVSLLILGVYVAGDYMANRQIYLVHSVVDDKRQVKVSCEHSYQCHPYTVTNSDGSTSVRYRTCYEHSNDFDWRVYPKDETFSYVDIDRIDRRGSKMPPMFDAVKIGEPMTEERSQYNYVKMATKSIYNNSNRNRTLELQKYGPAPARPAAYRYFGSNLVIDTTGRFGGAFMGELNTKLRTFLGTHVHGVTNNLIVVFTDHDVGYSKYLEYEWLNGSLNEEVVVIGFKPKTNELAWVKPFGWSTNSMVHIMIRDNIMGLNSIETPDKLVYAITESMKHFSKKSQTDLKYLDAHQDVSGWLIAFILMIQFIGNGFVTISALNEFKSIKGKK